MQWKVYWSPEGRCIATVEAETACAAKSKAPMPYRKYLGEIYVELIRCEQCGQALPAREKELFPCSQP